MKTSNNTLRAMNGFTLIELMIVVAVIAILAAIAFPSYQEHIRTTNRADAQASLLELSQFMERYYTTNGRYSSDAGGTTAPDLPFIASPRNGSTARYDLSVSAIGKSAYTLRATPTQMMADDKCGFLTLTNTGAKSQELLTQAICWKR